MSPFRKWIIVLSCLFMCFSIIVFCFMIYSYAAEPLEIIDAEYTQVDDSDLEDPAPEEMEIAEEQPEPVEGEITDAQFKSYVLGCLFFFVTVVLCYFGYKFFAMFF